MPLDPTKSIVGGLTPSVPTVEHDSIGLYSGAYIMLAPKGAGKSTFSLALVAAIAATTEKKCVWVPIDEAGATAHTPFMMSPTEVYPRSWRSRSARVISAPSVALDLNREQQAARAIDSYVACIADLLGEASLVVIDSATAMFQFAAGLMSAPAQSGGFVPGYTKLAAELDQIARDNKATLILITNTSLFQIEDLDAQTTGALRLMSPSLAMKSDRPTGRTQEALRLKNEHLVDARKYLFPSSSKNTNRRTSGIIGA